MTKMSNNRKQKKGIVEAPPVRRNLNPEELREFVRMTELVNSQMWLTMLVAGNTALVPNGQDLAKQMEAVAKLALNAKNQWESQTLRACGVPVGQAVKINSETGEIVNATADEIREQDKKVVVKKKK